MMPETLGVCTRLSGRIPALSNGRTPPANRTRFCETAMPRGLRSDWRTRFCARSRRNGYRFHLLGKARWEKCGRTRFWKPGRANRTRFCAALSFLQGKANPFLREDFRFGRTRFCVTPRRNGYARIATRRAKPLANKGFYPQKQVRGHSRRAPTGPQTPWSRAGFSDESSAPAPLPKKDLQCVSGHSPPGPPQKQVRTKFRRME